MTPGGTLSAIWCSRPWQPGYASAFAYVDTVGRSGGDEMLVQLPGLHSLDEAVQVAEKIRISAAEPIDQSGKPIRTTVSIGVTIAVPGESVSALTARADIAMYQAKDNGRNTVTCI